MRRHFVTACFPSFPIRADGGAQTVAHKPHQTEEVDVQFVNDIFIWGVRHLPDKHRYYSLFLGNGSRFVTWKKGTQSLMEKCGRSGLGYRTVFVFQIGTRLRDLQHAAYLMLFYPVVWLIACQCWLKGNCIRSHQAHFKTLQRLQSNPFLQITVNQV